LPERSFFSERTSRLQNTALYNPIQILNTEENQKAIQEAVLNSGLEQNSVKFGSVLSTGFAWELEGKGFYLLSRQPQKPLDK